MTEPRVQIFAHKNNNVILTEVYLLVDDARLYKQVFQGVEQISRASQYAKYLEYWANNQQEQLS
jgi:hypothetical protein